MKFTKKDIPTIYNIAKKALQYVVEHKEECTDAVNWADLKITELGVERLYIRLPSPSYVLKLNVYISEAAPESPNLQRKVNEFMIGALEDIGLLDKFYMVDVITEW